MKNKMHKKNSAFTLIEVLVVIVILLTVSIGGVFAFNVINSKSKEREYNKIVDNVKASAETYFNLYEEKKDDLYNGKVGFTRYFVDDLKTKGLIDFDTVNPKDNSQMNGTVRVYLDPESDKHELKIVYPDDGKSFLTFPKGIYFKVEIGTIKLDDAWFYDKIRIYDVDGKPIENPSTLVSYNKDEFSKNINTVGIYEIVYIYGGKEFKMKVEMTKNLNNLSNNYDFIGKVNNIVVNRSGEYKFEVNGSQGNGNGGKGAKQEFVYYINNGDTVDINVGGQNGYNGGGNDGNNSSKLNGGGFSSIDLTHQGIKKTLVRSAGGGGGISGSNGGSGDAKGGNSVSITFITDQEKLNNTGTSGQDGTNSGGGGAGNIYRTCNKLDVKYSSCATGENTCQAGYVNGSCNSYYSCSSCACYQAATCTCGTQYCGTSSYQINTTGYGTLYCMYGQWTNGGGDSIYTSCDSGYTRGDAWCSSSSCGSGGSCTGSGSKSCSSSWHATCSRDNYCPYSCTSESICGCNSYYSCSACGCSSYEQIYDSCKYGHNTCQAGNIEGKCLDASEETYYSGHGGTNYKDSSVNLTSDVSGFKTGNGIIKITYIGNSKL